MPYSVPFNRASVVGRELDYVARAAASGHLGPEGTFSRRCCRILERRSGSPHVLLTPSCTAALELAALLCQLGNGDEVIMPSFTFPSTANAVVRTGARPLFVDIRPDTLNLDESLIESAIGPRTRAILPVHYAGVGCEMDTVLRLADEHGLMVIEDAAQGVNAFYKGRALGSMGQLGTFSFHETKNLACGEGGALCVNDPELLDRAHILRYKGTNRQQFLRGEVSKYQWVDVGSSFTTSELMAAFLCGQLEAMDLISDRRRAAFLYYFEQFETLESEGLLRRPHIPVSCDSNYHLFFILLPTRRQRDELAKALAAKGIQAVSHYEPLHSSPVGRRLGYGAGDLPLTESVASRLLRLPLFFGITEEQQHAVVRGVREALEEMLPCSFAGLAGTVPLRGAAS